MHVIHMSHGQKVMSFWRHHVNAYAAAEPRGLHQGFARTRGPYCQSLTKKKLLGFDKADMDRYILCVYIYI